MSTRSAPRRGSRRTPRCNTEHVLQPNCITHSKPRSARSELWTRPPTFEFVLNYSKARANSVLEPVFGHGRVSAKLFALVRLARPLHFRRDLNTHEKVP